MRLHWYSILFVLGCLLLIEGVFMVLSTTLAFFLEETTTSAWVLSASYAVLSGFLCITPGLLLRSRTLKRRDIFLSVTLGWLVISLYGVLPYILTGSIPNFTDAFFESVSGITTTGASVLNNIESLPHSILLWRSLTQWFGGMGIIVLMIAILPFLGIGGLQLFQAEAPGVTTDKLKPRIKETAKILWIVYLGITVSACVFLWIFGMSFFDAINHALTTTSTGGFSTMQASAGAFSAPIQYILIIFMFISSINYALIFMVLQGRLESIRKNDEFMYYALVLTATTVVVTLALLWLNIYGLEESFRAAIFQIISLVTTTGFASADYTTWSPFLTFVFLGIMFVGGMTGSTSGSIKIMRHVVLWKQSFLEFKKQLHPQAVVPLLFNGSIVPQSIVLRILAFAIVFLLTVIVSVAFLILLGLDITTALGAVSATITNVGPGIGGVGPSETFSFLSSEIKLFLAFLMIVGRLELFTVFILFTPYFWRR